MTLISSGALCGCFDLEKEGKGPKMANVNKNRRRLKFQDRALFGYLEQNRRMEASVAQFFRSPCGGFVLGNQKVPYLETCNGETPVFSTT